MSHCSPEGGVAVEAVSPRIAGKLSTVALIGPPNSGKSTLFNRLTGLRQKVANYPGVTVEQHSARMSGIGHRELTLIDLPASTASIPLLKTLGSPSMCCTATCPVRRLQTLSCWCSMRCS